MKNVNGLRDEDSDWGLTRIQYAQLSKRRLKEREKKRRQRATVAKRVILTVITRTQEVFRTESGMLAVKGHAINRNTLGANCVRDSAAYFDVSLPYVAFLHGPISGALDRGAPK